MTMNTIQLLIIAGTFATVGDLTLASAVRHNNLFSLILGLILNLVGIIFYSRTLGVENAGIATAIFLGLNIAIVTIGSIFLFNERLSIGRISGLITLVIGLVMIEVLA